MFNTASNFTSLPSRDKRPETRNQNQKRRKERLTLLAGLSHCQWDSRRAYDTDATPGNGKQRPAPTPPQRRYDRQSSLRGRPECEQSPVPLNRSRGGPVAAPSAHNLQPPPQKLKPSRQHEKPATTPSI